MYLVLYANQIISALRKCQHAGGANHNICKQMWLLATQPSATRDDNFWQYLNILELLVIADICEKFTMFLWLRPTRFMQTQLPTFEHIRFAETQLWGKFLTHRLLPAAVFATHCCDQCDVGSDTDHQIEAVIKVVVVVVVVAVVLVSFVINAMKELIIE